MRPFVTLTAYKWFYPPKFYPQQIEFLGCIYQKRKGACLPTNSLPTTNTNPL
nr:MAG TPA: hypothetical protein [Caudoviricetes sp.]